VLREIYELGKAEQKRKELDQIDQLIETAKLKNVKKVFCLTFVINGENISYEGVDIEDYDEINAKRYLYRGGPPNGEDFTPSSIITDPRRTFEKKIVKWFRNNKEKYIFIKKISEILEKNKNEIYQTIEEKLKEADIKKSEKILLTLKFLENNNIKYLIDYKLFTEILIEKAKESRSSRQSLGKSEGEGICYLCGERKRVSGYVLNSLGFTFSTSDKPGFIGNFSSESIWKEIPICEDCANTLQTGKKLLDENLSYKFYNSYYYVVPEILIAENSEMILEDLLETIGNYKDREYHEGLVTEEDDLVSIAKEKGNLLKFIFIFYSKKGGGKYIDIIKYIENVEPSHIKKLYEIGNRMKLIYNENFVKSIFGDRASGSYVRYRDSIKGLDSNSKINWYIRYGKEFFKDEKEFLEYLSDLLTAKTIERTYLITKFSNTLREEFRKNNDFVFKVRVIDSMMIYDFLEELNLIKGEIMTEQNEKVGESFQDKIEKFFEERKRTFANNETRAAFLVGVLANIVLKVQRDNRNLPYGDEPFRTKLYDLNIDETRLKKIFKDAVEKLSEYKKFTSIQNVAADYLTKVGSGWKLNRDEISYYFSLGLALGNSLFYENINEGGEQNGSE